MARHIESGDTSFRRSLLRAAGGGLVALVVTFAITGLLTRLGREDPNEGPAVVFTDTPTVAAQTESVEPTAAPSTPSPEPAPTVTAEPTPAEITEAPDRDVTVQVLYSGSSDDLGAEAAEALRELGYEVVAVNGTQHTRDATTVLFSPGYEDAAEQLRDRDGRFGLLEANDTFVESVSLHVIVGPDFTAG
jgi:hypothetical protein